MAEAIVGGLVYQFKADTANLKAGLAEARAQLRQMADQAQQSSRDMRRGMEETNQSIQKMSLSARLFASTLRGALVGAISGSFLREINDAVEKTRQLEEASRALGVETKALKSLDKSASFLGIDPAQMNRELVQLAEQLREASVAGGKLADFLQKNGIALNDAAGNARPFQKVLGDIANLIRDADNEIDKLNALKLLGLSEEMARVFERGSEAVEKFGASATQAGERTNNELVRKWEYLQDAWSKVWENIRDKTIDVMYAVLAAIGDALHKMGFQFGELTREIERRYAELRRTIGAGLEGVGVGSPGAAESRYQASMLDIAKRSLNARLLEREREDAMADRDSGRRPLTVSRSGTRSIRGLYDKDTSGGTEKADQIERYIEQLKQAEGIAKAEAENWSKGNVERAKAAALARAEAIATREGRTLTDEQRQIVLSLAGATQQYKDRVEELRQKQQELNAAMREFADTVTNSLSELITRGKSARDVLADLARTLANSALRGALTGEGMFGQALGLSGRNGQVGGLFGQLFSGLNFGGSNFAGQAADAVGPFPESGSFFSSLFSGFAGLFAEGGTIPSGQWGIAGERGPEIITGPASVIPARPAPRAPENRAPVQHITFNVTSPDAPSFARSESQISALLARAAARGQRNI